MHFLKMYWWCMSIIPALGRLRQEDHKFKVSLGYIGSPSLKKKKKSVLSNRVEFF
jgi:hypothetical protein